MRERLVRFSLLLASVLALWNLSWSDRLLIQWQGVQEPTNDAIPITPRNRTLVVLLGDLRCGEHAWESLYTNVLDVLLADLLVVTEPSTNYPNASLLQRALQVAFLPKHYDDWSEALDLINSTWKDRVWPLYRPDNILLGGVGNTTGSGAIIFWYRWFVSQLLLEEHHYLHQYDYFVITRNDHYYACPLHIPLVDPDVLWIPEGEDYAGLSDRFLWVHRNHVLSALNILPPLLAHPERYPRSLQKASTEQFLRHRFKEQGLLTKVRRFPRTLYTCGLPQDGSRWATLQDNVDGLPIYYKYTTEYRSATATCANATYRESNGTVEEI